jgi:hypothetical protein
VQKREEREKLSVENYYFLHVAFRKEYIMAWSGSELFHCLYFVVMVVFGSLLHSRRYVVS